jgi:MFS family permease
MLHALTIYIVTTIMPSVVEDIGGLDFYAWSTTLFVVASILGAAVGARLLNHIGSRSAYAVACALFAVGALLCAIASAFPILLAGRFVQGFGGGLLYSLAYAIIRFVYPDALWARAISLVSAVWGISTLVGPAVGGAFAEMDAWRGAFWMLAPIATLLGLLAIAILPAGRGNASVPTALPLRQLGLLAVAVLTVSAASVSTNPFWNGGGMLIALGLIALLVRIEHRSDARLLPKNGLSRGGRLITRYATIALLVMAMQTDIFVPYFLQVLHDQSPLVAGYIAALMAVGWTLGSLQSASRTHQAALRAIASAPLLVLAGLAILAALVPVSSENGWPIMAISAALVMIGLGIGIAWPHLVTNVFREVPCYDKGLAASSITTVQLFATAVGAAIGGMLVNMGGIIDPGRTSGASSAAFWLFLVFLAAPALALISTKKIWIQNLAQEAFEPARGA